MFKEHAYEDGVCGNCRVAGTFCDVCSTWKLFRSDARHRDCACGGHHFTCLPCHDAWGHDGCPLSDEARVARELVT